MKFGIFQKDKAKGNEDSSFAGVLSSAQQAEQARYRGEQKIMNAAIKAGRKVSKRQYQHFSKRAKEDYQQKKKDYECTTGQKGLKPSSYAATRQKKK